MYTLGNEYSPSTHQPPLALTPNRNGNAMNTLRPLPRGRSPFRQSVQSLNMVRYLRTVGILFITKLVANKKKIYIMKNVYSRLVVHPCLVDNVQGQGQGHVLVHVTRHHRTQERMSMIVLSVKSCTACPEILASPEEHLTIDLAFKLRMKNLFCI